MRSHRSDHLRTTIAKRRQRIGRGMEWLEARRLLTGVELVSIDTTGDSAGSGVPVLATNPAINTTGRFVAFQSAATDLVAGLIDTNGDTDIFVRDRMLDVTIPISVIPGAIKKTGDARSFDPSISDDGRMVVFGSAATDLVTGFLVIDAPVNVYVHDRDVDKDGVFDEPGATETRLLSVNGLLTGDGGGIFGGPSGGSAFGFGVESMRPRVSGNGKFVTFASFADNLTVGITDLNMTMDIFRASTVGMKPPTMVSDDFEGLTSGGNGSPLPASDSADINRDGAVIAFVSEANNLVKDAELGYEDDIYAHNFTTRTTTLVSVNFAGTDGGDADSNDPDLSNDGRYVVWESTASNLTAPGVNTNGFAMDVFRGKVAGGPSELVSVNALGKTGDGRSEDPSISDSGRYVAFESLATDLITNPMQLAEGVVDANGVADIYVRDMLLKTTALVSINAAGTAAGVGFTAGLGGSSVDPIISGNGRYVVFESFAEDLVAGLDVAGRNLYVRDLVAGETRLVSEDIGAGDAADDGPNAISLSFFKQITTDGAVIAFAGEASDLVAPDSNFSIDVFASVGTPDLVAVSSTSSTASNSTISFIYTRVFPTLIGPFAIGFYRSTDELFDAGDGTPLITRSATGVSMTVAGFIYTLGGATGLPGAGIPDDDEDYSILAVVDHLDSVSEADADVFNEDNTVPFVADYQLSGMPWMVHGTDDADMIVYSSPSPTTLALEFNDRDRTLAIADVPATRIRAHGGDDTVTGSPLGDFIHGGAGDDTLFGGDGDDVIADGPGDDFIDGGDGDDTIISTPGSDDTFADGGGNDTLDFSRDDQPITIDLDHGSVQSVDPLGNTVRLIGQWENFVGSPLGGTLYAQPLAVARRLTGGSGPNDRLVFDGRGLDVSFDGSKFTTPGFGDVIVSGFEAIQTINVVPKNIDDGGVGYSDTGFGFVDTTQGFSSDVRFSGVGSGNTATWEFTNIVPGYYAVSATWTFAGDRATNSPFTIRDGGPAGPIVSTVLVNQEQNPGEFNPSEDGQNIQFRNMVLVWLTGGLMTVQLTDVGADQFVAADAIRIELLKSPWIIDNGDVAFSPVGFDPQLLANNSSNRGAFGDAHLGQDIGDVARYAFSGLPYGEYIVSATWTAETDRATNAAFHAQSGAAFLDLEVNQQQPPDDYVEGGIAWERLGRIVFDPNSDLLAEWQFRGATNGLVLADAVRLEPVSRLELRDVIDPGFALPVFDGDTVVLPDTADAGGVGPEARHRFRVENTGTGPLRIDGIEILGPGFSLANIPPLPFQLPPGASETFVIEVDAFGNGVLTGDVTVRYNSPLVTPFQFTVSQTVLPDTTPPEFRAGGIPGLVDAPRFNTPSLLPLVNQAPHFEDGRFHVFDIVGVSEVDVRLVGPGYDQSLTYSPDSIPAPEFESSFVFPRPLPIGEYTLTATAKDPGGNPGTSTPIVFEVIPDAPPVVELVSPENGDPVISGETIFIRAEAVDDVGVTRVEFLVNGLVASVHDMPGSEMFVGQATAPLIGRTIRLEARATDSSGQIVTSEPIEVSLEQDPAHPYFRVADPLDISGDDRTNVADLFLLLRPLAQDGSSPLPIPPPVNRDPPPYLDPSRDNMMTVFDAILVLRRLDELANGSGEAELAVQGGSMFRTLAAGAQYASSPLGDTRSSWTRENLVSEGGQRPSLNGEDEADDRFAPRIRVGGSEGTIALPIEAFDAVHSGWADDELFSDRVFDEELVENLGLEGWIP